MDENKYARMLRWAGLLSFVGAGQSLVQLLALISGFLVIQLITPQQYALYTLAYATLGTIGSLADGGIGAGVMACGARDWKNRGYLGAVLATGLALRRQFALAALLISLPILLYLLMRNGANWLAASLIVMALVPAFYATLSDDLLEIPLKLSQDLKQLQTNQALTNLVRVLALVGSLLIMPLAAVAILANGLPRVWGNLRLWRIVPQHADPKAPPDPALRGEMLGLMRRTLPGAIYYAASGQITIWLVSIYGSTLAIAQVGALGRFSAALAVLGAVFSTLVIPRFARLAADTRLLLSRAGFILAALTGVCIVVPLVVYLYPTQFLYLLGKNYADLRQEVVLSVLAGCANMAVGVLYGMSAARGWIISFVFSIVSSIVVQVLLILALDLSTAANVMLYSLYNAMWGIVMYLGYFLFRVFKLGKAVPPEARP